MECYLAFKDRRLLQFLLIKEALKSSFPNHVSKVDLWNNKVVDDLRNHVIRGFNQEFKTCVWGSRIEKLVGSKKKLGGHVPLCRSLIQETNFELVNLWEFCIERLQIGFCSNVGHFHKTPESFVVRKKKKKLKKPVIILIFYFHKIGARKKKLN